MALKTITIFKSEIKVSEEKRLDVKYFFVNHVFDELEKKSTCKIKTLSELNAKISSGSYIDTYIDEEKGIPYLRVGNIKPFCIDEQGKSLVFVSKNVSPKIKVKENDVILGRTQATVEKLAVASIIDNNNSGYVISQHVSKITLENTEISSHYLIGYFNSKFYKAQTALATHGDTRVEMTHSQLKKVKIFIPKKDILNLIEIKVNKIIQNNRNSIEYIKSAKIILKKIINIQNNQFEKYFTVKLSTIHNFGLWNAKSHLPKYSSIENEIKNKFKTVKLGKISSLKKGVEVGSDNYKTALFKNEQDYAFIRTSDITNNEIDIYPDYFVSPSLVEETKSNVNSGDIIFSKDGIIGETAIISKHDRVIVASGFAKIKLNAEAKKHNITSEYLFIVLSSDETGFFPAIRRTVIASTIPHLREERLKEIEIPILDKKSIDEISDLVKKSLELKDEKKKLIKEVCDEIDCYFDI